MDNTSLSTTTLQLYPPELLHPKRRTNRLLTFLIILIVGALFATFWIYEQKSISENTPVIIPVSTPLPPTSEDTMSDLQSSISEITVPDFHSSL